MRRSSTEKAFEKARSISSGVPVTAAGSGTPQCADIGWPGQEWTNLLAALSQTVKTKWSGGAPGSGKLVPGFTAEVVGAQIGRFNLTKRFGPHRSGRMASCAVGREIWEIPFRS